MNGLVLCVKKDSQLDQCGMHCGFRLVRANDTPIFNKDFGRFLIETIIIVLLQNKSGCKLTFYTNEMESMLNAKFIPRQKQNT